MYAISSFEYPSVGLVLFRSSRLRKKEASRWAEIIRQAGEKGVEAALGRHRVLRSSKVWRSRRAGRRCVAPRDLFISSDCRAIPLEFSMSYTKKRTLTAARLAANRKNALKSTRPRTPLGKSRLALRRLEIRNSKRSGQWTVARWSHQWSAFRSQRKPWPEGGALWNEAGMCFRMSRMLLAGTVTTPDLRMESGDSNILTGKIGNWKLENRNWKTENSDSRVRGNDRVVECGPD